MLVGLLAIAEEVADVDEGQGDAEPHGAHMSMRKKKESPLLIGLPITCRGI
jgi:hypothetical protein